MQVLNNLELEIWFKNQQKTRGQHTQISERGLEEPWQIHPHGPYPIHRNDKHYHQAVAVTIIPSDPHGTRKPWQQFMVEMLDTQEHQGLPINGIILLAQTIIDGSLSYLVQAKAEPGAIHQTNNIFLTTTIQASFSNAQMNPGKIPLWDQLTPNLNEIHTKTIAPSLEDPGIFFGKHNLLVLYNLSPKEAEALDLPDTHVWAEREAIREFQLKGEAAQFIADVLGTFT